MNSPYKKYFTFLPNSFKYIIPGIILAGIILVGVLLKTFARKLKLKKNNSVKQKKIQ